jgi:hypothetical protein
MVSTSMSCLEIETRSTFFFWEVLWKELTNIKDRPGSFDDSYPCMEDECNLFHVYNWIQFFVSMYNDTIANNNNDFEYNYNETIEEPN